MRSAKSGGVAHAKLCTHPLYMVAAELRSGVSPGGCPWCGVPLAVIVHESWCVRTIPCALFNPYHTGIGACALCGREGAGQSGQMGHRIGISRLCHGIPTRQAMESITTRAASFSFYDGLPHSVRVSQRGSILNVSIGTRLRITISGGLARDEGGGEDGGRGATAPGSGDELSGMLEEQTGFVRDQ